MPTRNGYKETLARIDESINGPLGVLAQMRVLQQDASSIRLILVGGINPATGKEESGLAQAFDHHIGDHRKVQRRNLTLITIIATALTTSIREILHILHIGP